MSLPDSGDIPAEWERSPLRGDEIGLRHRDAELAVRAVKATIAGEWELALVDSIDNRFSTVHPVGRVDGREQAVSELVSFAEQVDRLRSERDEVLGDEIVREVRRGEKTKV
ncbi:hypothetical protein [Haladaptatus salinisoli]|uniref:hypothetical protein n=1 Tax=Haladaptatus salinisoli TaxID=2884876 RepID=UPI001D0A87FD|nr:hypothetical protein [Haladaptatus salinisoli]